MSDAAAYASDRKLKLVMKPHGGNSGASDDIQAVMKAVNHPNFKIWYDAGNIIYYTGKDPGRGAEADRAPRHRVLREGLRRVEERGDDPVRRGQGGLRGRFRPLKSAGLRRSDHGRVLQDRRDAGGDGANARANREFLEKTLAGLFLKVVMIDDFRTMITKVTKAPKHAWSGSIDHAEIRRDTEKSRKKSGYRWSCCSMRPRACV